MGFQGELSLAGFSPIFSCPILLRAPGVREPRRGGLFRGVHPPSGGDLLLPIAARCLHPPSGRGLPADACPAAFTLRYCTPSPWGVGCSPKSSLLVARELSSGALQSWKEPPRLSRDL